MRFLWIICVLFVVSINAADRLGAPLVNAHAHNDYEHPRPLWDALEQGFGSIEADIYLSGEQLLVAHYFKDARPERTLQALYLDPLQKLVATNGGRVYPGGPSVILLIDIKTAAEPTYAALETVLQKYGSFLTRFRNGKTETNAVTVILSGNRPRERLMAQSERYAAYDGRLADLQDNLPVSFMPLASDSFIVAFPSAKTGSLSDDDQQAFQKAIKSAHAQGRMIRFWATADDERTWKFLRTAGVDLINTDNLPGLANFLRR